MGFPLRWVNTMKLRRICLEICQINVRPICGSKGNGVSKTPHNPSVNRTAGGFRSAPALAAGYLCVGLAGILWDYLVIIEKSLAKPPSILDRRPF
jgi:hypothetical protein